MLKQELVHQPISSIKNKRGSADNILTENLKNQYDIKKSPPTGFSHNVSLLNQFKAHIHKNRKYHPTTPSSSENDNYTHLSFVPIISVSVSYFLFISDDSSSCISCRILR